MYIILISTLIILILFLYLFSYLLKLNQNNKLSSKAEEIISKEKEEIKLPKIKKTKFEKKILQTYKSRDEVPNFVFDNMNKITKNWNYYFYDDKKIINFFELHFSEKFIDKFNYII